MTDTAAAFDAMTPQQRTRFADKLASQFYNCQHVPERLQGLVAKRMVKRARAEGHRETKFTKGGPKLSSEIRGSIIRVIREQSKTFSRFIASQIGRDVSTVSSYLAVLLGEGLIERRKAEKGEAPPATQWIYYLPGQER